MTSKTGKELSAILRTIKLYDPSDPNSNGIPADLWRCLPDQASGKDWAGFIVEVAEEIEGNLSDEDKYTFDDLVESVLEYADNNTPPYYSDQFEMIKLLSLWAIDEVEERVSDFTAGSEFKSIREQMAFYCDVAYQMTYQAICNFIMAGEDSGL